MNYLHGKTKATKGAKITVEFSRPTKVMIMTSREFKNYKNHRTFTYFGGEKESPFEFKVPKATTYHIVVEKGYGNNTMDIKADFSLDNSDVARPRKVAANLDEADKILDEQEGEPDSEE